MLTQIELEQAVGIINQRVFPWGTESIPLLEALGRTLAKPVYAKLDQPPFDRSPLDGYALRAEDTVGASRENPIELKVCDKVYAGDSAGIPVQQGQAVRIMTGAMLPKGCNCVIRQEDTDMGEPVVSIYKELKPGNNYVRQGEDYKKDTLLIPGGTRLEAAHLGVLSGAGLKKVEVQFRPRVAVLSTGSEIAEPGEELPAGKIYGANSVLLAARLKTLGVSISEIGLVEDNLDIMVNRMKKILEGCELLITTGGVSVGEKDLLHEVLALLGAKQLFWGVRMKPGTPAMFACYEGKYILCLSGNPFAAAATFELLARPILAALSDEEGFLPQKERAILVNDFGKKSPGRRFVRGCYKDGQVELPAEHSSGLLASMMGCNCLVDIPAGSKELQVGQEVNILIL
ncbi:MAG: gephyrin-like molybdotransferase Glp [Lachnospiraceae bacterium]